MTEEIEAHVLKKYEILQKLGKSLLVLDFHLQFLFKHKFHTSLYSFHGSKYILGKGAYGIVWKAIDKKTKDIVALKKNFDAF